MSEQRSDEVVVCSRWDEYNTYGTRLELSGAIRLQPLKPKQIQRYLTQTEKQDLWPVISQDRAILDLLKVPLWLSVLTLAHGNLDLVRWQKAATEKERLTLLLDGYIVSRLQTPLNSRYYKSGKAPTAKQTRRWLVWLAQNMGQDEFLIEQMQPSLLQTRGEKLLLAMLPTLDETQIAIIVGIAIAILFIETWSSGGGEAYLRHYALRFVLAGSGKIPYLYANFLNYCTERLLLQRVGGRFRFLHRTLQEHFAAMPLEDYGREMKP